MTSSAAPWRRVGGLGPARPDSLRIVLVLHSSLHVRGGAEEVTRRLVAAWAAAGHRVAVISYDDLPKRMHPRLRRSALPWFLTLFLLLGRAGRSVDVLDCSTGDAWLYGLLTKRRRRMVLVTRSHGLEPLGELAHQAELRSRGRRPSPLRQLYFAHWMQAEVRCSLKVSDVVRVLSEQERRYCLEELALPMARVRLRCNGFPDTLLDQELADPLAPLRLASIGRWERLKGCEELSKVLSESLQRLPDATAVLLGTGLSEGDVKAHLAADVRDRVRVVPTYPPDDLGSLLRGAHAYLSLSHTEGYSLGLVEAMACGLTPVATAVGAAPEVVVEGSGVLIGVGDVAAAVASVLALDADRARLRRMATAARSAVVATRWSSVAAEDLRDL